jgi:hypothetical protein
MFFEYLIAILIIVVYLWLIYFAVKGGNMTIGFLVAGTAWISLVLIAYKLLPLNTEFVTANASTVNQSLMQVINGLFQEGIRGQGGLVVDIIVGAWFGAVLVDTGIAAVIIRKTVELGGDKPIVVAVLLNIVVAGMFTSIFGIGAVIAIGVIVLPILLSLGIPKQTAAISYLFSVGAGLFLNPTLGIGTFKTYCVDASGTVLYTFQEYAASFGWIGMLVSTLFIIIVTIIMISKGTKVKTKAWAAPTDEFAAERKKVPGIALIIPFLPTLTILIFKTENIPTFLVYGFLAIFACGLGKGIKKLGDTYSRTLVSGINESASLIAFLIMLVMVTKSIGYARPFIQLLLGPIIPQNAPLAIALAIAVLAPLALFRGPLTMYGTAGPIYVILSQMGYPHAFLFPVFWVPSIAVNINACVTQSYVAWGISYTRMEPKEYLKKSIPLSWILCAILAILAYFAVGRY